MPGQDAVLGDLGGQPGGLLQHVRAVPAGPGQLRRGQLEQPHALVQEGGRRERPAVGGVPGQRQAALTEPADQQEVGGFGATVPGRALADHVRVGGEEPAELLPGGPRVAVAATALLEPFDCVAGEVDLVDQGLAPEGERVDVRAAETVLPPPGGEERAPGRDQLSGAAAVGGQRQDEGAGDEQEVARRAASSGVRAG